MGKGKPHKKHPHSTGKGKSKQHDDRIPKVEKISEGIPASKIPDEKVDDGDDANKEKQENGTIEENQETRKYARRKIVSNWDRYDEPEVVDEHLVVEEPYDETKDFEYIKLNAASASSHFKFKEEKDWGTALNSVTNEGKGILGLDLVELAADLKKYGLVEKLGLTKLLQDDYNYCIKDIYNTTPSEKTLHELAETVDTLQHRVTWSYDGIEQYEHLIGPPEKNQQTMLINKVEINKSIKSPDNTQRKYNDGNNGNNSPVNIVKGDTVGEHTIDDLSTSLDDDGIASLDSKMDDDILDELLLGNIVSNSPKSLLNNEKSLPHHSKNASNDVDDFSNNLMKDLPIRDLVISDDNSIIKEYEQPVLKNDDSKCDTSEINKTKLSDDELDLDMLLEVDAMPPGGECSVKETSNNEEDDGDLDQWLDDMLI